MIDGAGLKKDFHYYLQQDPHFHGFKSNIFDIRDNKKLLCASKLLLS